VLFALGAGLALLLLFNSIATYRFVSRAIVLDQTRRELSRRAAELENRMRQKRPQTDAECRAILLAIEQDHESLLWLELRMPDGALIAKTRDHPNVSFAGVDIGAHLRDREDVLTTIHTSTGEALVELFAIHAYPHAPPPPRPGAEPPSNRPPFPLLEIAMSIDEASARFWPIQRNLIIECSAALALLAATVFAGFRFRSYVRARELEQQLEIARQVQQSLLPARNGASNHVVVAAECIPAWQIGGDFYDTFPLNDDDFALVLGDVSGKGVPAALLAGLVHGAIRSSNWMTSPAHHEMACRQLNQLLLERASGERYATMFWCYYSHAERSLRYINAGHCPPLLIHRNAAGLTAKQLEDGGTVVGLLRSATYFQAAQRVEPGDLLLIYSDGIVEAANPKGEEYGAEHLLAILEENFNADVSDVREKVLASIREFSAGAPVADDLTLIVARFKA
jgi:sigma-B regulation protein RsbU (phosphoserine phosphatase)